MVRLYNSEGGTMQKIIAFLLLLILTVSFNTQEDSSSSFFVTERQKSFWEYLAFWLPTEDYYSHDYVSSVITLAERAERVLKEKMSSIDNTEKNISILPVSSPEATSEKVDSSTSTKTHTSLSNMVENKVDFSETVLLLKGLSAIQNYKDVSVNFTILNQGDSRLRGNIEFDFICNSSKSISFQQNGYYNLMYSVKKEYNLELTKKMHECIRESSPNYPQIKLVFQDSSTNTSVSSSIKVEL